MANDSRFKLGQSGNPQSTFKAGNKYRWQTGQSGNPAGTARSRLRFEECFYASLIEQGPAQSKRHKRSEEHTSELQSHLNLVCRLLLEKKKKKQKRLHLSLCHDNIMSTRN